MRGLLTGELAAVAGAATVSRHAAAATDRPKRPRADRECRWLPARGPGRAGSLITWFLSSCREPGRARSRVGGRRVALLRGAGPPSAGQRPAALAARDFRYLAEEEPADRGSHVVHLVWSHQSASQVIWRLLSLCRQERPSMCLCLAGRRDGSLWAPGCDQIAGIRLRKAVWRSSCLRPRGAGLLGERERAERTGARYHSVH
jgi:hypothetical protein